MTAEKLEQAQAVVEVAAGGILDAVLEATPKSTEKERMKSMVEALVGELTRGLTVGRDVGRTIKAAIDAIDEKVSKQLAAIMHHADFQRLEGSWRGLNYLVMNSETGTQLKLKVLNVSKKDLYKDLDRAVEFDQSQLFKKLYENEFGSPGGEPYGALIGDYEFTNHPEDLEMLTKISGVAGAAFCPFITSAGSGLLGLESFSELSKPRDLAKIFDAVEYTQWRSFRDSEDSRWVVLTMPRTLARLPYGSQTKPVEEFNYEEVELDRKGKAKTVPHDHYCWMSTAYVMGVRMTDSFAKNGWCTSIRGAENGGKVEGLPAHIFTADDGDVDLKCPTEIAITDRREKELSDLGFLPLCHYKKTDYAVFFGAQTAQKPKKFDRPAATANAAISARLPYLMATGRIAHYLKVIARDKIGSFMEVNDCADWLNRWIANYICADAKPTPEMKAKYPLAEAKIEVREVPGAPGSYNAVAWLRPWLQLEELTTSLRMVARIPQLAN